MVGTPPFTPVQAPPQNPQQQLGLPPQVVTTQQGSVSEMSQQQGSISQITTQQGAVSQVQQPLVIPSPKPRMGRLSNRGGNHVPWTGGKPNMNWSGLDPSALKTHSTPNQLRSTRTSDSQKSYNFRKEGLKNKFIENKSDLMDFKDRVNDHLVDTGMDTIAYFNDLQTPTQMYNVVESHNRFLLKNVQAKSLQLRRTKFDSYDVLNDESAIKFLLNSLDPKLEQEVKGKLDKKNWTFVIAWLTFIETVTATSTAKFERLKNRIKECTPLSKAGQNIREFVVELEPLIKELEINEQYDHELSKKILQACRCVQDVPDFAYKVTELLSKLTDTLTAVNHLAPDAKLAELIKAELTPSNIMKQLSDKYSELYHDNLWMPAKKVPNKGTPSTLLASHNVDPLTSVSLCTQ